MIFISKTYIYYLLTLSVSSIPLIENNYLYRLRNTHLQVQNYIYTSAQGDNSGNYGGYHFIHILTPPSITVKAESAVKVVRNFRVNIEQNNGPFCFNHLLGGRDADIAGFAVFMCHGDGGVLFSRLK